MVFRNNIQSENPNLGEFQTIFIGKSLSENIYCVTVVVILFVNDVVICLLKSFVVSNNE